MCKRTFVAALAALALAWAVPAAADNIIFDFNGAAGGGAVVIDKFDPTVGNSLSVGLNSGSAVGDHVQLLFQANLGIAQLGGATQYTNCLGGDCFTFVLAVDAVVTGSGPGFFTLGFGDNSLNTFHMYANNVIGDDLSGTCFTCGTQIISGSFVNDANFFAGFLANPGLDPATTPLDAFGINNYPGITTVSGGGSFGGNIAITAFDASYFPSLQIGATLFLATSEQRLNYITTNPSACFSSNAVANCDVVGAGGAGVGSINGLGRDTMLQTDASVSFLAPEIVPEPATLLLLGSGLIGSVIVRRRRARKTFKA